MAGELNDALAGIALPNNAQALVVEADRLLANRFEEASYREHLESKITELEAKIVVLEAEVKRLRAEKGIGQSELKFDPATGTYTESISELRYCGKCLLANKRNPMQVTQHGWRCACGASFNDPSRPYQSSTGRPRGSWMG